MKYFIITSILVLFSCGGGGGSTSSVQPQPAAQPAPVPSSSGSSSNSSTSDTSASSTQTTNYKLVMTGLNLSSADDIAQLKLGEQTTSTSSELTQFFAIKYLILA